MNQLNILPSIPRLRRPPSRFRQSGALIYVKAAITPVSHDRLA